MFDVASGHIGLRSFILHKAQRRVLDVLANTLGHSLAHTARDGKQEGEETLMRMASGVCREGLKWLQM